MNNNVVLGILIALLCLVVFVITFIYFKLSSLYFFKPDEKSKYENKKVIFVKDENYKKNADGECGYLNIVGEDIKSKISFYSIFKRLFDFFASFFLLILLSPLFLIISIAIFINDPGPILFRQKRMGKNKIYFKFHKFRSMKKNAPHNTPTHMLENPDIYLTKVGKFIRKHSIDELPQIWDIFLGNMSFIGPRPALWNQECLISEREKYNVNSTKPGLTGWAQINGRDTISLSLKAKLDGDYVKEYGLKMDIKCFFGSFHTFIKDDNNVEGKEK